jgi:hypothetical protein
VIPAGAIFFAHRRFQEHCGESGIGRFFLAFAATILAMSITTGLLAFVFLALVTFLIKNSWWGSQPHAGLGDFALIFFSIPLELFVAALISLPVGSRISRLFWAK